MFGDDGGGEMFILLQASRMLYGDERVHDRVHEAREHAHLCIFARINTASVRQWRVSIWPCWLIFVMTLCYTSLGWRVWWLLPHTQTDRLGALSSWSKGEVGHGKVDHVIMVRWWGSMRVCYDSAASLLAWAYGMQSVIFGFGVPANNIDTLLDTLFTHPLHVSLNPWTKKQKIAWLE